MMITSVRPVKDVEITNNSDTCHIFNELEQTRGFKIRNAVEE